MLILQQGVTTEMLISLQKQGNVDFMRTCELKNVDFTSISVKHWFHKDKWLQRPLQNSKMLTSQAIMFHYKNSKLMNLCEGMTMEIFTLRKQLIVIVDFTRICKLKDVSITSKNSKMLISWEHVVIDTLISLQNSEMLILWEAMTVDILISL